MTDDNREPMCLVYEHERTGIVTSGGGPGEGHAAVNVCDRTDCIRDALSWCSTITGLGSRHVLDERKV